MLSLRAYLCDDDDDATLARTFYCTTLSSKYCTVYFILYHNSTLLRLSKI